MPRIPLADIDDPRVAIFRDLKQSNLTRRGAFFVVEGEKLLRRLLASRFALLSALLSANREETLAGLIPENVECYVLPRDQISRLVGYNFHLGVLGRGISSPWPGLDDLLDDGPCTVVVCPRLTNPENLGAIARLADAFGVAAILVGPSCPDPFSRRVLRVSMGSVLFTPVLPTDNPIAALDSLRSRHGFEIIASVAEPAALPLAFIEPAARVALVLGDEDRGIDREVLDRCHRCVTIPMRTGADSLNVAVAAGIVLHHLTIARRG